MSTITANIAVANMAIGTGELMAHFKKPSL